MAEPIQSAETTVWWEAKDVGTLDAYERYLAMYPQGKYAEKAKERVSELRRDGEEPLWERVLLEDTTEGFEEYLAKYPEGEFVAKAKVELERLSQENQVHEEQEEEKSEELPESIIDPIISDADAWAEVVRLESEEAYKQYLLRFPNGEHAEEATHFLSLVKQLRNAKQEFEHATTLTDRKNVLEQVANLMEQYPDNFDVYDLHEELRKELQKLQEEQEKIAAITQETSPSGILEKQESLARKDTSNSKNRPNKKKRWWQIW